MPEMDRLAPKIEIIPFNAEMLAAGIALDVYNNDSDYKLKIDELKGVIEEESLERRH